MLLVSYISKKTTSHRHVSSMGVYPNIESFLLLGDGGDYVLETT